MNITFLQTVFFFFFLQTVKGKAGTLATTKYLYIPYVWYHDVHRSNTYIHIHTYTYIHIHIHIHIHMYIHIHTHTYMYLNIHTYTHRYTLHTNIHKYIYNGQFKLPNLDMN